MYEISYRTSKYAERTTFYWSINLIIEYLDDEVQYIHRHKSDCMVSIMKIDNQWSTICFTDEQNPCIFPIRIFQVMLV